MSHTTPGGTHRTIAPAANFASAPINNVIFDPARTDISEQMCVTGNRQRARNIYEYIGHIYTYVADMPYDKQCKEYIYI